MSASMDKILIVDDIAINRMMLQDILEDDYVCECASGGAEALSILREDPDGFGLVLLDLIMPEISGFDVLEQMNAWGWLDRLPVIVISGEDSHEVENRTLGLHATDYIRKPFDESVVRRRVSNVFDLYSYKRSLEARVEEQTEKLRESYAQLFEQSELIKSFNQNIIELLGTVVEYRHTESGQHIQRVKTYADILGHEVMRNFPEYGLDEQTIDRIATASVLHDLGKIAIPDSIMLKPGRLTPEEFEEMKLHTVKGAELITQVKGAWDDEFSRVAYNICRHHHERFDGAGYPDHLEGDDIPLSAQIVSIADVYDALVTDRVYKKAYTPEVAFKMIKNGECGAFSPKLLICLTSAKSIFAEIATGKRQPLGGGLN